MAEYIYNPVQTVPVGGNVMLEDSIPCTKGYIMHRDGSGILTLRGIVNGNANFARYQVTFNGNLAVPTGGAIQAIALGIAINGETLQSSRAIVTPTAADAYFNVTSTAIITVPRGCCATIAVRNTDASTAGATPLVQEPVNVQNANLTITRVA